MSESEIIEAVEDLPTEEKKSLGEKIKETLYIENKKKGVFDALQEKIISRKLLVFATATGLLAYAGLDPETWGMIAIIYISGQSVIDTVKVWKFGGDQ